MDPGLFDERVAAGYDAASRDRFDPAVLEPTVDFLAGLAGDGPVLELAVGTGRVALPLAARGIQVSGIDLSRPMVDRLRAKPGGDRIDVTIGDMATTRVPGDFTLVYLVYNTITNLLTQDEQVACFANAAAHLRPGGHFVVEVGVPAVGRLGPGERYVPFAVTTDHVGIDEYDLAAQVLTSHHYRISGGAVEVFASRHRYAWPAEYDLMARLAGLVPAGRWGGWRREPFTSDSTEHVSVWRKEPPR